MNLRVWIILSILSVIPKISQGQNSRSIAGKITDDIGKPIAGAHVQLLDSKIIVVTDMEGRYLFKEIPAGTYNIKVTAIGFSPKLYKIDLKDRRSIAVNFVLETDIESLEDIIVTSLSEKRRMQESAQAITVIETGEAKLKTADLGEVLAQTQGISIRRNGGLGAKTNFSLNGLNGNQIRFFLDGIPLYYHGYTFGVATVPVNFTDRIEVYKGIVPIHFGSDALGGAVNLISPKLRPGLNGSFSNQIGSFGTYRSSLSLSNWNKSNGFFIKVNGFYDYAKNSYKVDVKVADETGKLQQVTVPRFHDAYEGYGIHLKGGIKDKRWARELSIETFFTDYTKEIQHNQLMVGIPYGEVMAYRKSSGTVIRYMNEFNNDILLDAVMGYNYRERQFMDIADLVYNWYGETISGSEGNSRGEISESIGPSNTFTWNNEVFARLKSSWKIVPNHTLSLASAPTYAKQTGDDRLIEAYDPASAERSLFTWVNGIDYTFDSKNGQLENIFFIKHYTQKINSKKNIPPNNTLAKKKREVNYFGVGNGFRFRFTEYFSTKLTYEYATRLPQTEELFGDGQFIQGNLDLEPERSHNVNLELLFHGKNDYHKGKWHAQTNLFLRKIDNQILFVPSVESNNIYQNVFAATSVGVEIAGNWTSKNDKLKLEVNGTYQNFYNDSDEGLFRAYKGDRVPNQPYLFANGNISYTFSNLRQADDKLSVFLNGRYIHEFYRSWESASVNPFLIPSQQLYSLGTTYYGKAWNIGYALTAEVQNLSDEKNYDFYGVQKPGRAFYTKLVIQY